MEKAYSVTETVQRFISRLAESTGWKYLKSQRCLKSKTGDFDFEILFFTSKWNQAGESIDIKAEFRMICKKYGKQAIDNVVAQISYDPLPDGEKKPYWFDISTEKTFEEVYVELEHRIQNSAVALYHDYEKDVREATERMFLEHFEDYHVKLAFAADILGKEMVRKKAQELYNDLPEIKKQQMITYRNSGKAGGWIYTGSNLKYMVDHDLVQLDDHV